MWKEIQLIHLSFVMEMIPVGWQFSIYELSKWYEASKLFPLVKNYDRRSRLIIYLTAVKNNNKMLSSRYSQFGVGEPVATPD